MLHQVMSDLADGRNINIDQSGIKANWDLKTATAAVLYSVIEVDHSIERVELEKMYPERNLDKNAIVSRYAPSPTGFIHIGALLSSFTDSVFAKQTNGVFYLRIEDTDTKRTVENGINTIIDGLKELKLRDKNK